MLYFFAINFFVLTKNIEICSFLAILYEEFSFEADLVFEVGPLVT